MGCQTKIAEEIITQEAGYILDINETQKELHQKILDTFQFTPRRYTLLNSKI